MTATIEERDGRKVVVIPVEEILKTPEFVKILSRLEAVEKTVIGLARYTHTHDNGSIKPVNAQ